MSLLWIHGCTVCARQKLRNGRGLDVVHFVVMTRVARGVTGFFLVREAARASSSFLRCSSFFARRTVRILATKFAGLRLHGSSRCCRTLLNLPDHSADRVVGADMHLAAFGHGTPRSSAPECLATPSRCFLAIEPEYETIGLLNVLRIQPMNLPCSALYVTSSLHPKAWRTVHSGFAALRMVRLRPAYLAQA